MFHHIIQVHTRNSQAGRNHRVHVSSADGKGWVSKVTSHTFKIPSTAYLNKSLKRQRNTVSSTETISMVKWKQQPVLHMNDRRNF